MFRRCWLLPGLLLALLGTPQLSQAQDVPLSETLLPASTKGWFSTPDFPRAMQQWEATQYGRLLNDPAMAQFRADFEEQQLRRQQRDPENLGLTWTDLKEIAGREVATALVHPQGRQPSKVLVVDTVGKEQAAAERLQQVAARLERQGARGSRVQAAVPLTVYTQGDRTRWVHFTQGTLLCIGQDVEVMREMAGRLQQPGSTTSLATFAPFVQVMRRLQADLETDATPTNLRWFTDPVHFMLAREELFPVEEGERSRAQLFKKTGFDGIRGVGGFIGFDGEQYDMLHRVAAYAPKPWEKSLPVLTLVNVETLDSESWLTSDLATHTIVSADGLTAFDHFGPIFNERVGGGQPKVWEDSLDSFRQPPPPLGRGQGVDLREDIARRLVRPRSANDSTLVGKALIAADAADTITPDAERHLYGAKIYGKAEDGDDEQQRMQRGVAKVAEAIDKLYAGEVRSGRARLHQMPAPGAPGGVVKIYEIFPEEEEEVEVRPRTPRGGRPAAVPERQRQGQADGKTENDAVCVFNGYLLQTSHLSLMLKVIEGAGGRRTMPRDADYRNVMEVVDREAQKRGWTELSARRFNRSDEEFRAPYELSKMGRLGESRGLMARMIRSSPGFDGDGEAIDGRNLPDYQLARRFLKPGGALVRTEPDGWFAVSFTLKE